MATHAEGLAKALLSPRALFEDGHERDGHEPTIAGHAVQDCSHQRTVLVLQ